jgi:hypothetical protein
MEKVMKISIEFENIDIAKSNVLARELSSILKAESSKFNPIITQSDPDNMDMGSILSIVLSASFVGAIVKIIQDFLKRRHGVSLSVKRGNNTIIVKNITSKKAESLLKKLLIEFKDENKKSKH